MPHINEDDLLNLHSEIEKLTDDKNDLEDEYFEQEEKYKSINKRHNIFLISSIILFLLLLSLFLFYLFSSKKTKNIIQEKDARELVLQDSIQSLSTKIEDYKIGSIDSKELIYMVQIGNYKKIDLFDNAKSVSNFKQIKSNNYNTSLMGSFTTYAEVVKFKNYIQKLGIKDAFIVAYKDSEKINIREALVLSNETEYLN